MENIFLESYDVFKACTNYSGLKIYSDFLENNKRYSVTRCYYVIVVDNVFLTYAHLMLYEECLYLLSTQNKLKNGNFTLTIKKAELAKKFKTDISKSATEALKRLNELKDVKISILVKDKIDKQMSIIDAINVANAEKYSDIPEDISIILNKEFLSLYRCNYIDKIEYLNNFDLEQGSFIRYFIQHGLDGGVKSSAILDKMNIGYLPFSRKRKFEQEIATIKFYNKNEKYQVKDGFVVLERDEFNVIDNQNASIAFFKAIYKNVMTNFNKNIILRSEDLSDYYARFGNFTNANSLFRLITNIDLMLNQSKQNSSDDIAYFSRFIKSVVCKKDKNELIIHLELTQKGLEYILTRRANMDLWDIESLDYGLTEYPAILCNIKN
ncbi:hypothetical protein KDD93_06415 [Campylobacter sp. faydin G-24]|uniref:Uncharacterized protein n=1 Tax=Campylobacter anatolicus TaxID=2829105 RepID=A0ABS5HIW0_9BACT|nr:hypothetical protein [Campylobacter anatolicus]MBR8464193.1 hypothetical protein [Campylobacter anatolicus]